MRVIRAAAVLTSCFLSLAFPVGAQDSPQGGPKVNRTVFHTEAIRRVTAVTEVFGRGQKVTALVAEFAEPLAAAAMRPDLFAVDGRTILSVRATASDRIDAPAADGRFVVITLDPTDEGAHVFAPGVDIATEVILEVKAPLALAAGGEVAVPAQPLINTAVRNLVVDDFRQFRFTDPETGLVLDYNLFVPQGVDPSKDYPLVMFLHDAGVTGSNPRRVLQQGLGAVSFASPEDQARHPAYVLAPQFPVALANDASQISDYVALLPRLIASLVSEHRIDPARLYVTGQSGGCMTSLALGISHPELFAGTLCVAGQWDAEVVAPLADDRLWVIVSEDDAKAFPGMTAIMETLAAEGARITRGSLDARAAPEDTERAVAGLRSEGADSNVFFTTFTPGSVLPEGGADNPGAGHVNTWVYAYGIPAIRDWLFAQHR